MRYRRRPVLSVIGAFVLIGALFSGSLPASASSLPGLGSKGGETLDSFGTGPFTVTGICDPTSSSFTFSASGAARGPYPGTFGESGSFTLGPIDATTGHYPLTSFSAIFTITSGSTTVSGTKSASSFTQDAFAVCDSANTLVYIFAGGYPLAYQATITENRRTVADNGLSQFYGYPMSNDFVENFTCATLRGGRCH